MEAVGSMLFGILLSCLSYYLYLRRRNKKSGNGNNTQHPYLKRLFRRLVPFKSSSRNIEASSENKIDDLEALGNYYNSGIHIFSYTELKVATNGFANVLGDGGFGTVYKGKLADGRVVAVKRLYERNSKQVEQFINEASILHRLRHKNLVMMYGCTTHDSQELLLVYEYIPNGTVADHLYNVLKKEETLTLSWAIRLKIAIETAGALTYLHAVEPQIVHRDIKTCNILLTHNFQVKVADFGLSRLIETNVSHVSTVPLGTPGYVDPEYHQSYKLTDKSDVYSFGVVLVELLSSKPAMDLSRNRNEINLSSMAINKIQNDHLHELVDLSLGFDSDSKVRKMMESTAEIAFRCLQPEKEMRPTMQEVLEQLEHIAYHNCDDGANDASLNDNLSDVDSLLSATQTSIF